MKTFQCYSVRFLRTHGVDCLTTQQATNHGRSDEQQLIFATAEARALFTFNHKDFLPLVNQWHRTNRSYAGLILSKELPLAELLRRFRRFLHEHQHTNLINQTFWLRA